MSGVIAKSNSSTHCERAQVLIKGAAYEVSQLADPDSLPTDWAQVQQLQHQSLDCTGFYPNITARVCRAASLCSCLICMVTAQQRRTSTNSLSCVCIHHLCALINCTQPFCINIEVPDSSCLAQLLQAVSTRTVFAQITQFKKHIKQIVHTLNFLHQDSICMFYSARGQLDAEQIVPRSLLYDHRASLHMHQNRQSARHWLNKHACCAGHAVLDVAWLQGSGSGCRQDPC